MLAIPCPGFSALVSVGTFLPSPICSAGQAAQFHCKRKQCVQCRWNLWEFFLFNFSKSLASVCELAFPNVYNLTEMKWQKALPTRLPPFLISVPSTRKQRKGFCDSQCGPRDWRFHGLCLERSMPLGLDICRQVTPEAHTW